MVCHVETLRTLNSRQLWAAHCMPGSFTKPSVSTTTINSRHGALTAQERATGNGTSLQERSLNRDKIPKPHLPHSAMCRGMSQSLQERPYPYAITFWDNIVPSNFQASNFLFGQGGQPHRLPWPSRSSSDLCHSRPPGERDLGGH